jgi:hypothetical protein
MRKRGNAIEGSCAKNLSLTAIRPYGIVRCDRGVYAVTVIVSIGCATFCGEKNAEVLSVDA